MSQRAIEGENVILTAKMLNEYIPFACATAVEFYYDSELKEKATVGMQGFKSFVCGIGEWGLTLSSVTHILPPVGSSMYTVFDSLLQSLRKAGLDIQLIWEDKEGNLKTITGHVMIPHTGINSPVDGFSEDTIEMKGSGSFAISTTLITPGNSTSDVQPPIGYYGIGGELSVTFPQLILVEPLLVFRDGLEREIITVGTPTSKQVKYDSASGTISWTDPLGPGEWVNILYK